MFNIKILNKLLDVWFKDCKHVELAKKSVILGVMTSIFLVIIKFIGWYSTGSLSLQASMGDSLSDAFVSYLVFHAMKFSNVKFDDNHNFGHEKVEGLVSVLQSLVIFGVGLSIIKDAYLSWGDTEVVQNTTVGVIVMLISTFMVYQLIYFQKYVAGKTDSILVKGDSLHYLSDFCMNLAVIGSLVVSNYIPYVDKVFGVVVGIYIILSAFKVLRNALVDLMDEALPKEIREKIIKEIRSISDVKEIKSLRTRSAGMKKYVEAVIFVDDKISLNKASDITKIVEEHVKNLFDKADVLVKAEPLINTEVKIS